MSIPYRTNPVFVSEYQMPDDFNLIYEFSRNRLLAGGGASVSPTEKVFLLDNRGEENE